MPWVEFSQTVFIIHIILQNLEFANSVALCSRADSVTHHVLADQCIDGQKVFRQEISIYDAFISTQCWQIIVPHAAAQRRAILLNVRCVVYISEYACSMIDGWKYCKKQNRQSTEVAFLIYIAEGLQTGLQHWQVYVILHSFINTADCSLPVYRWSYWL